jgi:hypothetical protein
MTQRAGGFISGIQPGPRLAAFNAACDYIISTRWHPSAEGHSALAKAAWGVLEPELAFRPR